MRAFAHVLSFVVVALLGWFGGSLCPAPAALIAKVSPQALASRVRGDLEGIQSKRGLNWTAIQALLGRDEAKRLTDDAIRAAQQAGSAIKVEHVVDEATKEAEEQTSQLSISIPSSTQTAVVAPVPPSPASTLAKPALGMAAPAPSMAQVAQKQAPPIAQAPPTPTLAVPATGVASDAPGPHGFKEAVSICPGMAVSDAPPADGAHQITNFSPLVTINGDVLAVDPIRDACFSSGFGTRNGRLHKGVDFYNPAGGPILAAGDGTILEMKYRDDYGNMLLIDHGHGVYTRYAHLSSFHNGLAVGAHVHAGDEIGLMGNTAGYPVPLHLHYEILLGDYSNPKGSFGLTPHSPFEYRSAM